MTHEPTSIGPNHTPATCYLCGRHAVGLGLGSARNSDDPRWLCALCAMLCDQIRAVSKFDTYEDNALGKAIDMVGHLVERNGSDLADWSERQVREFVTMLILSFGEAIREQVRTKEVPF
jgi:hypothetical protein